MKILMLVLVLLVLVTNSFAQTFTQKAVSTPIDSEFSANLDEKTIINVLTTYSLLHIMIQDIDFDSTHGFRLYGYSSAAQKQILINDNYVINARRLTILHELYHVVFWKNGLYPPDEIVDSLAYEKFKQLYGQ